MSTTEAAPPSGAASGVSETHKSIVANACVETNGTTCAKTNDTADLATPIASADSAPVAPAGAAKQVMEGWQWNS